MSTTRGSTASTRAFRSPLFVGRRNFVDPEGSVIGESAPEIDTVEAIPRGLRASVPLSNEAIKSGNGDLAGLAINSLSRDLANQIDKAFYANTTTNGPKGLGSIAATTVSPTASTTSTCSPRPR
ncbi:phage major capsid protein [Rhodococcus hoagii]|nr:phage major capsid protein [Prescottella equi]